MFDFLDGPVRSLITQMYEVVGYLGVAIWVAIESVIVPIPSELVLPFAGFLAGQGGTIEPLTDRPWALVLIILAGTIGATAGALIAYGIGYAGGRPLIVKWGRYIGISAADLERTERFFERHGSAAALFGRLIPVVRSLVSFAAGVARMPLGRFILFTFLGSLPWTALLVVAGSSLGANWGEIGPVIKRLELVILAGLASVVLVWVWLRIVRPRMRAAN